jgi:hypothetical protein
MRLAERELANHPVTLGQLRREPTDLLGRPSINSKTVQCLLAAGDKLLAPAIQRLLRDSGTPRICAAGSSLLNRKTSCARSVAFNSTFFAILNLRLRTSRITLPRVQRKRSYKAQLYSNYCGISQAPRPEYRRKGNAAKTL